ncbi:cytochrome c oxidase subunit 1 [Pichia californica]|uniref:Cytochrome c oxidase subunit 1 n=1 Tax=Pichia californica TaxID=460514 RepID=A0A9P6WHE1_9ASCO|nr:cytochrome c oxidase subunit 1 [[Candida] californica]
MVGLSNDIIYIFVGLILSDGNIEYRSTKGKEKKIDRDLVLVNSRFRFKQSMIHVSYLLYVFILLSHYCISPPKIKKETVKGKQYFLIEFLTRSLPVFTLLRHKFYVGRVKIIPSDIYDYISYESLAHIIMCDGSHMQGGGVVLNLHNFTIKELVLLINVLKIKFDLDCNLHKIGGLSGVLLSNASLDIAFHDIKNKIKCLKNNMFFYINKYINYKDLYKDLKEIEFEKIKNDYLNK